ncbi:hypothetical protein KV205_25550 [Streptomyces sp. SKN60]|uniref:hypothetical protein n=1 Tax=Streptomyces sp. SKN60 TaxID=2855506 RepID=UPI0022481879|nr:hypothetical protein [Streptomyces sp. SKN60]MCX2183871.1 hypothetical protein [Streptomyces sp. SKN60]
MKSLPRQARWPLHVLRASAALLLLDTLLQAALAGLFVTGDLDLLAWHAANAELLGAPPPATASVSSTPPAPAAAGSASTATAAATRPSSRSAETAACSPRPGR